MEIAILFISGFVLYLMVNSMISNKTMKDLSNDYSDLRENLRKVKNDIERNEAEKVLSEIIDYCEENGLIVNIYDGINSLGWECIERYIISINDKKLYEFDYYGKFKSINSHKEKILQIVEAYKSVLSTKRKTKSKNKKGK